MPDTTRRGFSKVAAGVTGIYGAGYYLVSRLTMGDRMAAQTTRPNRTDERPADGTDGGGTDGGKSHYVSPDEDVEGIQRVIREHGPNVSIELGHGEYVGSELTVPHGVQLRGKGRNATVLKLADGADTDLARTPSPDERSSMQVRLENITFHGNNDANSDGDIVYGAFWNGRFVDCDFVHAPNNAFWLAGSRQGSTDDNIFRGCRFVRAENDALRLGTNREAWPALGIARVQSCWFGNNGGRGVYVRGNGNIISNGKFYGNRGTDVVLDRGKRNLVADNDLAKPEDTSATCIRLYTSADITASANRIGRNVIWGHFRDGIRCESDGERVESLQIHDNVVTGSGDDNRYGVLVTGDDYEACSLRDNAFTGSFSAAPVDVPATWATDDNVGE